MANYVVLFLLNDLLFLETSIATEIYTVQIPRLPNFVTYCHVLFNRCVLLFLSVHLFVLSISVTSLTSFQLEKPNDIARPSERNDVDVVCGVIYKCNRFSAEQIIINMSYQEFEIFRFDGSNRILKHHHSYKKIVILLHRACRKQIIQY
jgi:hypothetical protein